MGQGFKDLRVWQRAHALADRVVALTDRFPPSEIYALSPQLRRAARSVSHNIAEGVGRPVCVVRGCTRISCGQLTTENGQRPSGL